MIDQGKYSVLGVNIDAVDYETATVKIIDAARDKKPYAVSALAVHGVMTGAMDAQHLCRLNALDLLVPDGQPVRWALNWLHRTNLKDRVYGPELTLRTLRRAEQDGLPVYFYGSTHQVIDLLQARVRSQFPKLTIAGAEPSKFRSLTAEERAEVLSRISASGARLTFVGLGCPRQEVWAYENRSVLQMPILAVGAAFDFHAGSLRQAPQWMQSRGLEWLFRLGEEPRRLWRRYLILNPSYLLRIIQQKLGILPMNATPDSVPDIFPG